MYQLRVQQLQQIQNSLGSTDLEAAFGIQKSGPHIFIAVCCSVLRIGLGNCSLGIKLRAEGFGFLLYLASC